MDGRFNAEVKADLTLLIECLKCQLDNPTALKQALLTVSSICSNNDAAKEYLQESSGLMFIFELIGSTDSPEVQEAALYCLGCCVEKNVYLQKQLSTSNVFSQLQQLLSIHSKNRNKLKQTTVYLIICLVANNSYGQVLAMKSGCLQALIALLKTVLPQGQLPKDLMELWFEEQTDKENLQLWASVTNALCVCVNNPQNEDNQRLCASLLPYAFKVLIQYMSGGIVRPLASLIGLIVANNPYNQERVSQCGGLESLIRTINTLHSNSKTGRKTNEYLSLAVRLVNTMDSCIGENADCIAVLEKQNVMKLLLSLLESEDDMTADESLQIILTIGHVVDLSESIKQSFIQADGVPLLVQQLAKSDSEELSKPLKYILQICVVKGDKSRGEHVTESDDVLVELEHDRISRYDKMIAQKITEISNKLDDLDQSSRQVDHHKQLFQNLIAEMNHDPSHKKSANELPNSLRTTDSENYRNYYANPDQQNRFTSNQNTNVYIEKNNQSVSEFNNVPYTDRNDMRLGYNTAITDKFDGYFPLPNNASNVPQHPAGSYHHENRTFPEYYAPATERFNQFGSAANLQTPENLQSSVNLQFNGNFQNQKQCPLPLTALSSDNKFHNSSGYSCNNQFNSNYQTQNQSPITPTATSNVHPNSSMNTSRTTELENTSNNYHTRHDMQNSTLSATKLVMKQRRYGEWDVERVPASWMQNTPVMHFRKSERNIASCSSHDKGNNISDISMPQRIIRMRDSGESQSIIVVNNDSKSHKEHARRSLVFDDDDETTISADTEDQHPRNYVMDFREQENTSSEIAHNSLHQINNDRTMSGISLSTIPPKAHTTEKQIIEPDRSGKKTPANSMCKVTIIDEDTTKCNHKCLKTPVYCQSIDNSVTCQSSDKTVTERISHLSSTNDSIVEKSTAPSDDQTSGSRHLDELTIDLAKELLQERGDRRRIEEQAENLKEQIESRRKKDEENTALVEELDNMDAQQSSSDDEVEANTASSPERDIGIESHETPMNNTTSSHHSSVRSHSDPANFPSSDTLRKQSPSRRSACDATPIIATDNIHAACNVKKNCDSQMKSVNVKVTPQKTLPFSVKKVTVVEQLRSTSHFAAGDCVLQNSSTLVNERRPNTEQERSQRKELLPRDVFVKPRTPPLGKLSTRLNAQLRSNRTILQPWHTQRISSKLQKVAFLKPLSKCHRTVHVSSTKDIASTLVNSKMIYENNMNSVLQTAPVTSTPNLGEKISLLMDRNELVSNKECSGAELNTSLISDTQSEFDLHLKKSARNSHLRHYTVKVPMESHMTPSGDRKSRPVIVKETPIQASGDFDKNSMGESPMVVIPVHKRLHLDRTSEWSRINKNRTSQRHADLILSSRKPHLQCPGCCPVSCSEGNKEHLQLNSHNYNVILETHPGTCQKHRYLRELERRFIDKTKAQIRSLGDSKPARTLPFRRKSEHGRESITRPPRGSSVYDFSDSSETPIGSTYSKYVSPPSSPRLALHRRSSKLNTSVASNTRKQRVPYTEQELENLKAGVQKFGSRWKQILCTYEFHPNRTNVDLKDKYKRLMAQNLNESVTGSEMNITPKSSTTLCASPSNSLGTISRPSHCPFSMCEERRLRRGVKKYGHNWKLILYVFKFSHGRTKEQLREKWRTMHGS